MNSEEIRKAMNKRKKEIEREFDVIIVENEANYIAYENKIKKAREEELCRASNLTDLRSLLKLYLS